MLFSHMITSLLIHRSLLCPSLFFYRQISILVATVPILHMDLADGAVAGAWSIHPFRDVGVGSTSDARNVNVASGVVVAGHVAAVVDGTLRCALGGLDGVGKRHPIESGSQ